MRLHPYIHTTVLVMGLLFTCSSPADGLCDANGAFHQSGISPHKACIAEEFPEFADYSNLLSSCTLEVYLTNLAQKEVLENELRPAYERHVEALPWCDKQKQPIIEFERAGYGYRQMSAWKAAADLALQDMEPSFPLSVALCDAKLHLPVNIDATKQSRFGWLSDLGIPGDAYVSAPDALEVHGTPIVGPPAAGGVKGDKISLPISFGTEVDGGELILGHTGLLDTMHLLPPCPGHGPTENPEVELRLERPGTTTNDILSGPDDQTVYAYIPAQASMSLAFDSTKQLAALTYVVEDDQEGLVALIGRMSEVIPLQRIYADDRIVFMVGERGSVFVTMGAERDWYDEPYRVVVSYAHGSDTKVNE